jgi:hypothetical protein
MIRQEPARTAGSDPPAVSDDYAPEDDHLILQQFSLFF